MQGFALECGDGEGDDGTGETSDGEGCCPKTYEARGRWHVLEFARVTRIAFSHAKGCDYRTLRLWLKYGRALELFGGCDVIGTCKLNLGFKGRDSFSRRWLHLPALPEHYARLRSYDSCTRESRCCKTTCHYAYA